MNEYENQEFNPQQEPLQETPPQQEAPPQQPNPSAYHGTGRKEFPYANSPYVMNHQPEQTGYRYQPPRQDNGNFYQPYQEAPTPPKSKKPRTHGTGKRVLAAVLAVVLVAGSCGITAALVNNHWKQETQHMETSFNQKLNDLQKQIDTANSRTGTVSGNSVASGSQMSPSQVYANNVSSVVAISATIQSQSFYGVTKGTATGSGFILTEDGYVITNCHVVEDASDVSVITHDKTEYPATIVGKDSTNDIAVLKVEATGLPAATLGSSDDLTIGDMVVAIGNPLGELTATQTVGYVSGKDRDVTTDGSIISMIQTDAAINSGNSGGPLFNMYGEVVGVTTAKYSGTSGSGATIEGIGFAIPIDDVKGIISDLIDLGYVTGAYLGISVSNTDEESASKFGLPIGAYVLSVEKGGSADRAGVQPKDIIIDLGGTEVTGITTLTRALRNFKAGDTTTITVVRSGGQLVLDITLDEKPQSLNTQETIPQDAENMPSEGDPNEWFDYYRRFFGN
ncbi:MAG: S1C family serine protease [Faecousia sp.]